MKNDFVLIADSQRPATSSTEEGTAAFSQFQVLDQVRVLAAGSEVDLALDPVAGWDPEWDLLGDSPAVAQTGGSAEARSGSADPEDPEDPEGPTLRDSLLSL